MPQCHIFHIAAHIALGGGIIVESDGQGVINMFNIWIIAVYCLLSRYCFILKIHYNAAPGKGANLNLCVVLHFLA